MWQVQNLEEELHSKRIIENDLKELEARCVGYEASITEMQPKYQDALNDRGQAAHELQIFKNGQQAIVERNERLTADISTAKNALIVAEAELLAARRQLANSTVPEIAEMQNLKDELAASRRENTVLLGKMASDQNTFTYMQNAYQEASAAAGAANSELSELQAEVATLRVKASANVVRIHEIHAQSESQQLLARIDELTNEKTQLAELLDRKTEENKAMMNGRRQTRGGSVPRSPRLNNTMSPRGPVRVMGNGSRGTSPAPGEAFGSRFSGEALFTGQSGRGKHFGNHLNE